MYLRYSTVIIAGVVPFVKYLLDIKQPKWLTACEKQAVSLSVLPSYLSSLKLV